MIVGRDGIAFPLSNETRLPPLAEPSSIPSGTCLQRLASCFRGGQAEASEHFLELIVPALE